MLGLSHCLGSNALSEETRSLGISVSLVYRVLWQVHGISGVKHGDVTWHVALEDMIPSQIHPAPSP